MLGKVNFLEENEIGFKELSWSRKDLDYFIKKNKENQSLLNNIYNEVCRKLTRWGRIINILPLFYNIKY